MAKIKLEMEHGIMYECPKCDAEVELGQCYCQDAALCIHQPVPGPGTAPAAGRGETVP